jgi:septal ring factor EnvC (AmiA/AmiB activator)
MTDEPTNLVLEQLRAIRGEIAQTNLKIGTLAESMVAMRRQIDDLRTDIHGLRTDIQMIAIAVDQHTARLDRIEARLNLHDA